MAKITAKQAANRKEIKRVALRNQEHDRRVLVLESFREQQNERFYDFDQNQAEVNAESKILKEKVTLLAAIQATKNEEIKRMSITNQKLKKKVESLESELKQFGAKFQSLFETVESLK
eukprot:15360949-Ditylum_brightwellii.AAC.1